MSTIPVAPHTIPEASKIGLASVFRPTAVSFGAVAQPCRRTSMNSFARIASLTIVKGVRASSCPLRMRDWIAVLSFRGFSPEPFLKPPALRNGNELCVVWAVWQTEKNEGSQQDRRKSCGKKNPLPSRKALNSIEIEQEAADERTEQITKCTAERQKA